MSASSRGSQGPVEPSVWTVSTYFAEGFPYNIVHKLAEILFTDLGASATVIGLTSLFHLPLNLKFLWAPWADKYGTKRAWLIGAELALAVAAGAVAIAAGVGWLTTLSVLFIVTSLLMATHDIAIDGFYLEALDKREQARFVGLKAPAYRVALLLVGGPLVSLVGVAESVESLRPFRWTIGFGVCSVVLIALTAIHGIILPRVPAQARTFREFWMGRPGKIVAGVFTILAVALVASLYAGEGHLILSKRQIGYVSLALTTILLVVLFGGSSLGYQRLKKSDSAFAKGLVAFMGQPRVGYILAFILTFRMGESFLEKQRYVFLSRELLMTKEFYGLAQGTFGMLAGVVAPLLGGWLISRDGLRRWIWPFVFAQNALNLLYFGLAWLAQQGPVSIWLQGGVIVLEMFGAGLGTAVFMVFIMRCCMDEHRAAHMALLTSLMSVGWTLSGTMSGLIVDAAGFAPYFFFTFLATIPGMLLIFRLPHLDQKL